MTELATGHVTVVDVSTNDGYSLALHPGLYRITGGSPKWDDGKYTCVTTYPVVHIARNEAKLINVLCLGL